MGKTQFLYKEQENQYNDEKKQFILTLIYWQIFNEKYVPKHVREICSTFYFS